MTRRMGRSVGSAVWNPRVRFVFDVIWSWSCGRILIARRFVSSFMKAVDKVVVQLTWSPVGSRR